MFVLLSNTICFAQTTLILQPDPTEGKDALLHGLSSEINKNYGTNSQFVASAWTFGGEPASIRSLISFNLNNISSNAQIIDAKLSLYAWDQAQSASLGQHWNRDGSNACWLERVTTSWDELTVTWNNQPKTTSLNRINILESTSATQNYLDINVTQLLQDIINKPDSSFGFMLKLQNETYYRTLNFNSSDNLNSTLRPKLTVTYKIANDTILVLQPDSTEGKDALLHGLSSETNKNNGKNQQFAAAVWTFQGEPGNIRSVIEFNLKNIPKNKKIKSVQLSLYAWDQPIYSSLGPHFNENGSNACWIERVTTNWNEFTVNWNNQPRTSQYHRVNIPASINPTQNYLDIDVTQLVKDMISLPDSSFGFMLKLQNETYYRNLNFCSSDHPNSALHPKLTIKYDMNTDIGTNINEYTLNNNQVSIFPNPARNNFIVDITTEDLSNNSTLIINNKFGQQIKRISINNKITSVDICDLNSDIYIYTLIDKKNTIKKTGKLIVKK